MTENLSDLLGLRGNSTSGGFENRRDKKFQQEKVKEAGLRSVRQLQGTAWTAEVAAFCEQATPHPSRCASPRSPSPLRRCRRRRRRRRHRRHCRRRRCCRRCLPPPQLPPPQSPAYGACRVGA